MQWRERSACVTHFNGGSYRGLRTNLYWEDTGLFTWNFRITHKWKYHGAFQVIFPLSDCCDSATSILLCWWFGFGIKWCKQGVVGLMALYTTFYQTHCHHSRSLIFPVPVIKVFPGWAAKVAQHSSTGQFCALWPELHASLNLLDFFPPKKLPSPTEAALCSHWVK